MSVQPVKNSFYFFKNKRGDDKRDTKADGINKQQQHPLQGSIRAPGKQQRRAQKGAETRGPTQCEYDAEED